MSIIGPAVGYVVGGQLLQIYTDFLYVDVSEWVHIILLDLFKLNRPRIIIPRTYPLCLYFLDYFTSLGISVNK